MFDFSKLFPIFSPALLSDTNTQLQIIVFNPLIKELIKI